MRSPLALVLLLIAGPAAARGGPTFLLCEARVKCEAAAAEAATVPKNAYLISVGDNVAWLKPQKAKLIANVNQLLKRYGFPVTAKLVDASEIERIEKLPHADAAVRYTANTVVATVGYDVDWVSGMANTEVHGVDDQQIVFGPMQPWHVDRVGVRDLGKIGLDTRPEAAPSRARAMIAYELVHEFVHAAHARFLGTVLNFPPGSGRPPPKAIPEAFAQELSRGFISKLGIGEKSGHMDRGLMTAGGEHAAGRDDTAGGSNAGIDWCLNDRRIPVSRLDDLAALADSGLKCTQYDYPVGDYFELPDFNKQAIQSYYAGMGKAGCYEACYYRRLPESYVLQALHMDKSQPDGWWKKVK